MPDSSPSSASIGVSLNLAKALDLARRGRLQAAQMLLAEPDGPIELHALAALATSAGDFPRALALWRQLLQQEPRHAEARRMIAAIELWESRPPWYRFIPTGAAAVGVALVAAAALFTFSPPAAAPEPVSGAPVVSAPVASVPPPATAAPEVRLHVDFHPLSATEKRKRKSAY